MTLGALDWDRDGLDWPHRQASRFVDAGGLRWHVQILGDGPVLLLLHGTGASTHSWRDLLPLLAAHYRVVAPDLPGHGFTQRAADAGMSLAGMAGLLSTLLEALHLPVEFAVGHSAGAALLARMTLDRRIAPRAIVSLNGAFFPFEGFLRVFSPVAKFLASTSLAAELAAARGRQPGAVERLLESTGSTLDEHGTALYARLVGSPSHVAGALAMMANWDLRSLQRALPGLRVPMLLVVGTNDRTVPAAQADRLAAWVPGCRVERLPGLGHLAHEERPDLVAAATTRFIDHVPAGG